MSLTRHRGAPPGNTNALKHGFYSSRFIKHDLNGIDRTSAENLADEIALIRVFTRRLIESSSPNADINEIAGVLRAICLASATITRLIKAHAFLVNDPSFFNRDIDDAIRQVRLDLGLDQPASSPPESDEDAHP